MGLEGEAFLSAWVEMQRSIKSKFDNPKAKDTEEFADLKDDLHKPGTMPLNYSLIGATN